MHIKKRIDASAVNFLKRRGFSNYIAPLVWNDLKKDLLHYHGASIREKIWSYRRGFLSERIKRYGLNQHNYLRYLPDFAYKRMHPINGTHSRLIDNKLILRDVFQAHAQYLPRYYWHIDNKHAIRRLLDCPVDQNVSPTVDEIISTLPRVGSLAAKPTSGSGGFGFIRIDYLRENSYAVNHQRTDKSELIRLLAQLKDYLITEYLFSHPSIRQVFDKTPNTLRLVVASDSMNAPAIIGGFMRFGLISSGSVDNAGAGAIFCGLDMETGTCYGARRIVGTEIEQIERHPDSGTQINGFTLPNWSIITSDLLEIARSVPELKYMGFDIVITDNAFKFIEINSLPDIQYMQPFQPIFDNPMAAAFFKPRISRVSP